MLVGREVEELRRRRWNDNRHKGGNGKQMQFAINRSIKKGISRRLNCQLLMAILIFAALLYFPSDTLSSV